MRSVQGKIRGLKSLGDQELVSLGKELGAPAELLRETQRLDRLPVVNFAAGGIATPADAALMMQLGADGVFVGSGIFKSQTPERMAEAIVKATTHYDNDDILAEISTGLGEAMPGLQMEDIPPSERLAERGW